MEVKKIINSSETVFHAVGMEQQSLGRRPNVDHCRMNTLLHIRYEDRLWHHATIPQVGVKIHRMPRPQRAGFIIKKIPRSKALYLELGEILTILLNEYLRKFKSLLFCFYTFGVRSSIDQGTSPDPVKFGPDPGLTQDI